MQQIRKNVALGINLETAYGRNKLQGIFDYMRKHQPWSIPLTNAIPRLSDSELMSWDGDGAIIETYSNEVGDALVKRGIPVINTYSQQMSPPLPTITINNKAIGRMAAEHLLQKEVDHFAFIGLPGLRYCEERLQGFSETLKRHKCTPEVFWVGGRTLPGCLVQPDPYINILTSLKKPVSVFATNDRVGFGILAACKVLNLPCPDAVSLVAVDNDDILCSLAAPQMSSIHLATEKIGYRAAELLAAMMAGKHPLDHNLWEELPPRAVVQRHSSDVMSVADPLVAEALRVIRSRVEEGIDVSAVLKTLQGSRRSLERKFKETLGRGIYEEIRHARIERAQELLRDTQLSVAKIAHATGFNSITRFGITFRDQVGLNATEYRNHQKRKPTHR